MEITTKIVTEPSTFNKRFKVRVDEEKECLVSISQEAIDDYITKKFVNIEGFVGSDKFREIMNSNMQEKNDCLTCRITTIDFEVNKHIC